MRSAAALLGVFVLGSLAFTACDGDDDTIGGSGTGGSAAKGGKGGGAGKGGSNGATGGTSTETGGTGATGGSSDGGAGMAGSSGAAGDDGTGGTVGAAGAGAGGEAGSTGGEAGGGGSGPAPTPLACTYECVLDADCDPAHGYTCVGGLCLDAERACNVHDDCVAWATSLTEPCAADTDCEFFAYGDLCIDVGGNGLCVMVPFEDECAFGEATLAQKFGLLDTATVCLDLSGRCDAHQCSRGCTSDPDFCTTGPNDKRGPVCDSVSGKCGGCTSDSQCGGPGTSHCNLATGVCGCQDDVECDGLAGMDACIQGKCSCSAASCTAFPSATPICG